jgi:hypothetical protein
MAEHAKLGGSSCPRWVNCPGSVRLCQDIPPTTSDYADEGTAAHLLGSTALKEWKAVSSYLGQKYEMNGKAWKVTDEMIEAVQHYVTAVRLEKKAGCELYVEQKFDLAKLDPKFKGLEMFGTNDACVSEVLGKLTVFDYKHGQGVPVSVERNYQLMFYALGAYLSLKDDNDLVELVVVQPRCSHAGGPIRRWQLTPEELLAWAYNTLLPAALESIKPDAGLKPGYWCNDYFCPAQASCPALFDAAKELAQRDFAVLEAPEKMSIEQIAETLKIREFTNSVIAPFFTKVADFAKAEMERGVVVPGWKLVQGRAGNRKWLDEKLVANLLVGYGDKIYVPQTLLSPAQMDKTVKAIDKTRGVERNPQVLYDHLIIRNPPSVSIAPEHSSKPALIPSISDDFDSVNDDLNDLF